MYQRTRQRSREWPGRLTSPAAGIDGRLACLQGVSHHEISLLLQKLFAISLLLRDLALFRMILFTGEIDHLGFLGLRCLVQLISLSARTDSRQHRLTDLLFQIIVRLLLIVQLLLREILLVVSSRRDHAALQHRMTQRQRRRLRSTCARKEKEKEMS